MHGWYEGYFKMGKQAGTVATLVRPRQAAGRIVKLGSPLLRLQATMSEPLPLMFQIPPAPPAEISSRPICKAAAVAPVVKLRRRLSLVWQSRDVILALLPNAEEHIVNYTISFIGIYTISFIER